MQDIPEPHQGAMVERCRRQSVVLAVQDTTMLNDSGLEATQGLVDIGGSSSGSKGIAAHAGVAFSEGGCALGVFSLDGGFRAEDKATALEGEESGRWTEAFAKSAELAAACLPRVRVVAICDREGDMWSLLSDGGGPSRQGQGAVRARGRTGRRRGKTIDIAALWRLPDAQGRQAGAAGRSRRPRPAGRPVEGRGPARHARGARPGEDAAGGQGPARLAAPDHRRLSPKQDNVLRIVEKRRMNEEWFAHRQDRDANQGPQPHGHHRPAQSSRLRRHDRMHRHVRRAPRAEVVHEDEIRVLAACMSKPNHRQQRDPPDPDQAIAEFAVNTGRLAGFIPSRRQVNAGRSQDLRRTPDPVALHRELPRRARARQRVGGIVVPAVPATAPRAGTPGSRRQRVIERTRASGSGKSLRWRSWARRTRRLRPCETGPDDTGAPAAEDR